MSKFSQFLKDYDNEKRIKELTHLFEHEKYKKIPGTNNSYRQDSMNTNTRTQVHSQVYAKPNGNGTKLYAVNFDGSGHDGSSGVQIPSAHADFFRVKGYKIKADNILESVDPPFLDKTQYTLMILED